MQILNPDGRRHSPDLHSRKQTRLHRVHLQWHLQPEELDGRSSNPGSWLWYVIRTLPMYAKGKPLSLNVNIINVFILLAGLSNVYARPDGIASVVVGLAPGTKDLVNVTYSADCCSSQVDIIGVDTQGNVGKCVIDMGALGGNVF